jgi:tetratricopeptide (TPR) repeat protein
MDSFSIIDEIISKFGIIDRKKGTFDMENFLPAYRDPLFSILLILSIALIISVATYGWGVYKRQKEQANLLKFLDKFESNECSLDTQEVPFEEHILKPLLLLAKAFDSSGEYQKAINIYIYLIKNITNSQTKSQILEMLGSTYLHAGFLQRAESIYLEILKTKPRNKKVLYELGVVYEMMHEYEKAKEVISPLEILGDDTKELSNYIELLSITNDTKIPIEEKTIKLIEILHNNPNLYRDCIKSLLSLDTAKAWQNIDTNRLDEILDILWFLPNSQLDLDIISSDATLSSIYYAKGYLQKVSKNSGIFSVDTLASAKESGCDDATLSFSYLCSKCKHSFPVSFSRCPNCMAINSIKVEEQIAKTTTQTDYSIC